MRAEHLVGRARERAAAVALEVRDGGLAVRETLGRLVESPVDGDGVEREEQRAGIADAVHDRQLERDGRQRAEQVDADKVDRRDERGEDGLTSGGDRVRHARCVGEGL